MFFYIQIAFFAWFLRCQTSLADDTPVLASKLTLKLDDDVVKADEYEKAAIATDHEICSKVGKDILQKEGSAVDATIAALFCLGTVQFQSTGIGGGGFMQVYERKTKKIHVFDFKEALPAKDNEQIYDDDRKKTIAGGLAVGVPSEVKGLRAAWQKFGKLKWGDLVQPSIDIAKEGFKASKHLADHAKSRIKRVKDETLRELILEEDGSTITTESTIIRPKYAKTLETIRDNPDDFYTGELAKTIINDITENGGSMTLEDLAKYEVKTREAITMKLGDLTMHTPPLPSGGPVLKHILSICKEYNFKKEDLETTEKAILTYHRIVEAFKISHAYRSYLGDPDFARNEKVFRKMEQNILEEEVAKSQCKNISDEETQKLSFYTDLVKGKEEDGTTHVSLIAENGDAVSATSSINFKFGALFSSKTTGIIYNNQIADTFPKDSPWRKYNTDSKENAPVPHARPLSLMAPSIILNENGDVVMVSGGSGGSRIALSVAWVTMLKFWFGMDLGNAVMTSRPYHSLFPQYIRNERWYPMKKEIVNGLKEKKHEVKSSRLFSAIQAIYVDPESKKIYAKADPRKQGKSEGY